MLAGFVTVLLCSNLIGAGKAAQVQLPLVGNVVFGAGVLFFPISYAFGNIFTEVYGYAYDRRAVWCGFGALLFAVIMSQIVINLTPAPGVLAKMKVQSGGKRLWLRVIASTAAGQLVDSALFYFLAFYGIWPLEQVIEVAIVQYILKTSWEILAVPLTYKIVGLLKRVEHEDHFDKNTDFNPFKYDLE